MKKYLLVSILAAFLAVSCSEREQEPDAPNVNFTPCRQTKASNTELSGRVEVEFTTAGVQITHYDFEVTCDFTAVDVTHTFVNGVLSLAQQGSPNMADCVCYTDVSYTIDGISQDEVNVVFINGEQVYCYASSASSVLQLLNTELGGCNIGFDQKLDLLRSLNLEMDPDTVINSISEDIANVFVGLNYQCKTEPFDTEVKIIDDVMYMYIIDMCDTDCYARCYCYYTFEFAFRHEGYINQKYKIILIDPRKENPTVISEGVIRNTINL